MAQIPMSKCREAKEDQQGHVLLFGGPHGAGKDTLERLFSGGRTDAVRVVRHITRLPTPSEVDGQDYYFVDERHFLDMASRGAFIEYAKYIGVMSGTSYAEINERLHQAQFADITSNFEDALTLYGRLGELGASRVCFFISPVPEKVIREDPDQYLDAVRQRLTSRGRTSDLIEGRLRKAAIYRELYFANAADVVYVDNSDGRLDDAGREVARVALALVTNAADPGFA